MGWMGTFPRAPLDPWNVEAWGVCDRCSAVYRHSALHWQYGYSGNQLINRRLLVCENCLDIPFENSRPLYLAPDPESVMNARPPFWQQQEGPPPPDIPVYQLIDGDD